MPAFPCRIKVCLKRARGVAERALEGGTGPGRGTGPAGSCRPGRSAGSGSVRGEGRGLCWGRGDARRMGERLELPVEMRVLAASRAVGPGEIVLVWWDLGSKRAK